MQDDTSRMLYEKRIMFALTGDIKYLNEAMISVHPETKHIVSGNCVLFGTGLIGRRRANQFPFLYAVDNNAQNANDFPIPVYTVEQFFEQYNGECVYIAVSARGKAMSEICTQLMKKIPESKIIKNIDHNAIMYFDLPELEFGNDEVFVDAGAFDGRTALTFSEKVNNQFKHIYCFEPDDANFREVVKNTERFRNITVENYGLWNESTELCFNSAGTSSSLMSGGSQRVKVKSLDEIIPPPTYQHTSRWI
jgi:hypothetical protein